MGMKARVRYKPQPTQVATFGFPFRFYGADPHEYDSGNAVYDMWFVDAPAHDKVESLLPGAWQWKDAFARVELTQPPDDALFQRMRRIFRDMHAVAALDQVWLLAATEDESEWSVWSFDEGPPRQAPELATEPDEQEAAPVEQLIAEARANLSKEFYGTSFWPDMFSGLVPHAHRPDVQAVIRDCIFAGRFWQQIRDSPLTSEWLWSLVNDTAAGMSLRWHLIQRGYEPAKQPPTLAEALTKPPKLMGTGVNRWVWNELREVMAASSDRPVVRQVLQHCIDLGYMHDDLQESQLSSEFLASLEVRDKTRSVLDCILIRRGYEPTIAAALAKGEHLNALLEAGEDRAAGLAVKEMEECVEYWGISGKTLATALMERVATGLSAAAAFDVAQPWLRSGRDLEALFLYLAKAKSPDSRWLPIALEHPGDLSAKLAAATPHADKAGLLRAHAAGQTLVKWPLLELLLDDDAVVDDHIGHRPDDDIEQWIYLVGRLAGKVELTGPRIAALIAAAEFAIARIDHLAEITGVGRVIMALIPKQEVDWKSALTKRSAFYGDQVAPGHRLVPWEARNCRDLARGLNRLAKATKSPDTIAKWLEAL